MKVQQFLAPPAPPFAVAPIERSEAADAVGFKNKVCAPCNPKNEKLFCHLAPVAALPAATRNEEAKRKSVKREET